MLSLLEIITWAYCATEYFVPGGSTWSTPLGRLVSFASSATGWPHERVPARTARATAPSTKSLNIDPSGRAVDGESAWTGVHLPLADNVAASKPTSGASDDSSASSCFHDFGGRQRARRGAGIERHDAPLTDRLETRKDVVDRLRRDLREDRRVEVGADL